MPGSVRQSPVPDRDNRQKDVASSTFSRSQRLEVVIAQSLVQRVGSQPGAMAVFFGHAVRPAQGFQYSVTRDGSHLFAGLVHCQFRSHGPADLAGTAAVRAESRVTDHIVFDVQKDANGIATRAGSCAHVLGLGWPAVIRLVAPAFKPGLSVGLNRFIKNFILEFIHDVVKTGHFLVRLLSDSMCPRWEQTNGDS